MKLDCFNHFLVLELSLLPMMYCLCVHISASFILFSVSDEVSFNKLFASMHVKINYKLQMDNISTRMTELFAH